MRRVRTVLPTLVAAAVLAGSSVLPTSATAQSTDTTAAAGITAREKAAATAGTEQSHRQMPAEATPAA